MSSLRLILAACVGFSGLAAGHAGTFDAVGEFSLSGNPNGVWSYGSLSAFTGGTFTLYATKTSDANFSGSRVWSNGQSAPNTASVLRNTSDTITTNGGSVVYPPGLLELDGENLITDVRWTAPAAGVYNITGYFQRDDNSSNASVSVRVVENGATVLFSADNFKTYESQQPFNFTGLSLPAGTTLDFAEGAPQFNNDSTGLSVVISTVAPNFPVLHLVNGSGKDAVSVLNAGSPFVTDFRGTNDVTITEPAGSLEPVYIDNYGGANPGNNPSYLTTFYGATETGTGAGVTGELRLLDTNDAPPNASLQFDFTSPLTTDDRILIADVDTTEEYQIAAFHLVNGTYQPLSLTGWTHEQFSGQTGIQPDDTWPTWDPMNGTLTSNANSGNINEPLDVFTPDVPVDRFVFTKLTGNSGDAGIQVLGVSQVPVITSAATAAATVGAAFSYQIVASGAPTRYGVQGLPGGLSINGTTGLISGAPKAAGTYPLTLNAFNSHGQGSATLTLTVTLAAPVITSPATASATVGNAFSYPITASGNPTSYGVQGLPGGLTINATTGLISGTPKATGKYTLTLNAYNSVGKGSATLTLTVAAALPVITSATTATGKVSTAFSYQITATGSPTSFGAQGLPGGLTVNATTGLISGTPKMAGKYTLTLNAYNATGKGSGTLTLTVTAP